LIKNPALCNIGVWIYAGNFPEGYHVPYLRHPYHETLLVASRQKKKYAVMEYSGKMKKSFDEIFFTQTDFRNNSGRSKEIMKGFESVKLSTAFFSFGALQILGPMELPRRKQLFFSGSPRYLNKLIPVFLICKKPKHRQEKHK
jgi:hypothetical protein